MAVNFPEFGIGSPSDRVVLAEHDARWAGAYKELRRDLEAILVGSMIELQHIGSTAVPGLKAKPILDVLGMVESIQAFDNWRERLEGRGWAWKGEFGIAGRRYAVFVDPASKLECAHLHVFERRSPEVVKHLRFRDALRTDEAAAQAYQDLKERAAEMHADDRESYQTAKAVVFQSS